MMTLQETCATVDSLLINLETAKKKQALADALHKRSAELADVETPLLTMMLSTHTLLEGGILNGSLLPDTKKATERIASAREQLAIEPLDITKGQSFNLLCRSITNLTEQCDALAKASWDEYVKVQSPVIDKSLLDQHRDSPQHGTTVEEIETIVNGLKASVRKPPQDATLLQSIRDQWARIVHLLSTMPISDDPEVKAFLNAAAKSEGAALSLFTPAVKCWLEENSMISDFCVRRSR